MWKSTQRLLTVPPISNNKQTKDYFRATALVDGILLVLKKATLLEKNLWKLLQNLQNFNLREEMYKQGGAKGTQRRACHDIQGQNCFRVRRTLPFLLLFIPTQDSICPPVQQDGFATWRLWEGIQGHDGWVFFLKSCQKLTFWLHTGKNVPFKAFGFTSTYDFLQSLPEAVMIILLLFPRNSESPFLTSASF